MTDLRLVDKDGCSYDSACFKALARRLRDYHQPITPDIRESLACIVENLETIYTCQQDINELLKDVPAAGESQANVPR